MGTSVARLLDPTQLTLTSTPTTFVTVPTARTWVVKSIILVNQRVDTATHNYTIGLLISAAASKLIQNELINPGEMHSFEFAALTMNAGDAFQINGNGSSGLFIQMHGALIQ